MRNAKAQDRKFVDFGSDQLLAEQGADQRIEPASLTKLMCAYAVFSALREGRVKMDETVLISEHAWHAEGSRTFVQVGTRVPVDVLIKGMIIQSGNDATIALAERIAGSEGAFVQMMNGYAQRLGMRAHQGVEATGLPAGEYVELSLLEPHKHFQNSISIFQKRTHYKEPLYSEYA